MIKKFKFIDLFAGIGGFHIAMSNLGGECIFASEIDPYARKTYLHNFDINQKDFNQDITKMNIKKIPEFDVLCAGFPCQPFSQAGKKRGFNDHRGNLFFNIADILNEKQPNAFFLENVRGIKSHDDGNTFASIKDIIENRLGYSFYSKIIKASDFGLPQLRPRTFMVGFKNDEDKTFEFPRANEKLKYNMSDVLNGKCSREIGFTLRVGGRGSKITDRRNWDSYYVNGEVIRIGPKEGLKMQGFPKNFNMPVSQTQAMKQLGNSVAIDAIQAVGENIIKYIK
ncbi:MAG: DNA (cytosine-5-)-methyltransferase [Lentimicrobiaceae bacterium]|nr:DNA (cytosine-5-)-methyltransferase [Lentimicrobiaceae bacterium]